MWNMICISQDIEGARIIKNEEGRTWGFEKNLTDTYMNHLDVGFELSYGFK